MMSSNLERNLAISRLCEEILISNDHIYFVSSVTKSGKVIESKFRNDRIIKNMSKEEYAMFFLQKTLQTSLSMEFNSLIGPLDFITVQRENLLELIFPYSAGNILVVCDLDVIPRYLAKKISFVLRDFDWRLKSALYA